MLAHQRPGFNEPVEDGINRLDLGSDRAIGDRKPPEPRCPFQSGRLREPE
jgi:hypothetical protein